MLKDIRRKSKGVRQQYAFWGAVSVTAVIALIWGVSLQYRFNEPVFAEDVGEAQMGAFAQFVSDAKANFANVFSSISEQTAEEGAEATVPVIEEATDNAATTTQFIMMPRTNAATATKAEKAPRNVRVAPASEAGTSTETSEQ